MVVSVRLFDVWCVIAVITVCALHTSEGFSATSDFQRQTFKVKPSIASQRLDVYISERHKQFSRSYIASLCEAGHVLVNGKSRAKHYKLSPGQRVELMVQPQIEPKIDPERLPLEILYEDEHMIAINKPPGMVVHPAPGTPNGTFANALVSYLNDSAGELLFANSGLRPGIVHRLDKGSSGVLLAAKTQQSLGLLSDIFAKREIEKTYLCVCVGHTGTATISEAIGRHPRYRQKMAVLPKSQGKLAISHTKTLAFDGKLSICKVNTDTGRTHQIRVHLQHRRSPILGDDVYGNAEWNKKLRIRHNIRRPLLHAFQLAFKHPFSGKHIKIEAPLSPDIRLIANKVSPNFVHAENGMLTQKLDDISQLLRTVPSHWYTALVTDPETQSDGVEMPTSEPPSHVPLW